MQVIAQTDSLNLHLISQLSSHYSETIYATAGEELAEPLSVIVVDSSESPAPNIPILFKLVSHHENESKIKIESMLVYSDSLGVASTNVFLGAETGTFIFSARIKDYYKKFEPVYFTVKTRDNKWIWLLISGIVGGLGLFLYGMYLLSEGLKKAAGTKIRAYLALATKNRFIALGVGVLITTIIQSSSATTVMLVSFVQAGLMSFIQTLGVILGASIGTTITLQLIAFRISDYALLILGIGFFAYFFSKSKKIKYFGQAVLGFGILFFGMEVMAGAMSPLRTFESFVDVLLKLENPILGILIGTLFTALIQSSAAFLGIVLVLSAQGFITLDAAIPLIFGANIGTSITAILASISTSAEAKRVAFAHTLFKVIAVLIFVWWIPEFAELTKTVSSVITGTSGIEADKSVLPRQIANAHTIFNVFYAIAFLPFLSPISKLVIKILPDKEVEEVQPYNARFLESSLISTPALAVNLAKAEVINFAHKVKRMTELIIIPFFEDKPDVLNEIKELEKEVDFLQFNTAKYLTKISQQDVEEDIAEETFQALQCSAEFEFIADLISSRLRSLAKKRIKYNLRFSEEGKAELAKFHLRTVKQVARAIAVFKDTDFERGRKLENKYQKYKGGELDLKRSHFERLRQDIPESIQTNELHLELIDLFLRINRHAAIVGRIMIGGVESEEEENEKANGNGNGL